MGGEVQKKIIAWDVAPEKEYFEQLFRISRNQVIWGGNYFDLPPTRCFLIWRKTNVPQDFTMAMAEYAWTSFNSNAKVFSYSAVGLPGRFHPSEKPVQLYEWIYEMFAKPGYKILDTHLGSGTNRIAAYNAGLDFTGYEIDETYFKLQEERFAKHTMLRAINDFQGIRKGQVWELKELSDKMDGYHYTLGFLSVCIMRRKIDNIESNTTLWQNELEENFEWVKE